jgi:peptide/nickel transport system permease protein
MRVLDVILAFPQLVLVLLFVAMLGQSPWLIALLVGVGWAPSVARITRGLALQIVKREFIEAVQLIGLTRARILLREILPNIATPLLVEYGLRMTWSIGVVAAVSFLGFGVQPPNADWGLMINENRNGLVIAPWGVVLPVVLIALFTIGTNLLAEGISRSSSQDPEPTSSTTSHSASHPARSWLWSANPEAARQPSPLRS